MTLSALIKKGSLAHCMTVTPATLVTSNVGSGTIVAAVATVAVVTSLQPMTQEDEALIRAWLEYIEETEPMIINEVIERCRVDTEAQAYFLRRTAETPKSDDFDNIGDRRRCSQCAKLTHNGSCLAAKRGELDANRHFKPMTNLLRRCAGYSPKRVNPVKHKGER